MKNYYILITLLLTPLSVSMSAQTLQPTATEALLFMLIVDKNDQPISEEILIISKKNKQVYKTKSNAEGLAEVLIPINATYSINLKGEPNYDEIVIPNEANYGLQYKIFYDVKRTDNFNIATINYTLKTSKDKPLSEKVTLINLKTKAEFTFQTDKNGNGTTQLPNDATYSINYESVQNYDVLTVPKMDNFTLDFSASYEGSSPTAIYPNRTEALFVLTYLDLDSIPVPDEIFTIKAINSGKLFTGKTNENGVVKILVPIGDTYQMNATYFKNFWVKTIENDEVRSLTEGVLFFISSKEHEKRLEEREKIIIKREADWRKMRSLYDEYIKSMDNATNRAEIVYDGFEGLSDYAPFRDTLVPVVLNRNPQWTNKLLVVDVTSSMTPYAEQVKIWYRRNKQVQNQTQFVFFNDGNNTKDERKVIGNTGGIYFCPFCPYSQLVDTLRQVRLRGEGGDAEENDLEAIIGAINNSANYSDVIVIVDNLSPVRDISLLSNLNRPVRIILCGNKPINEEYINIAYQTGGSIHTMKEDIFDINSRLNGIRLQIRTDLYILTRGRFVRHVEK
jgi:hypothetical protein